MGTWHFRSTVLLGMGCFRLLTLSGLKTTKSTVRGKGGRAAFMPIRCYVGMEKAAANHISNLILINATSLLDEDSRMRDDTISIGMSTTESARVF